MALYEICPRQEYWDYAYSWADYHKWQPRNGNTTHHADDQCCLQTYIDLYRIAGDPKMIQGAKANMNMMLAYPTNEDWWWIDAVQMAMPIYTKLYTVTRMSDCSTKLGDSIPTLATLSATRVCTTRKRVSGGATRTSTATTKSLTARTATGAVATDGLSQPLRVSLTTCQRTTSTTRIM